MNKEQLLAKMQLVISELETLPLGAKINSLFISDYEDFPPSLTMDSFLPEGGIEKSWAIPGSLVEEKVLKNGVNYKRNKRVEMVMP